MYGITIDVVDTTVQQLLTNFGEGLKESRFQPVIGRSARNTIKQHLVDYNRAHPNQMGAKRTNYWAAAARATSYSTAAGAVTVSISHPGVALRYFGGVVKPVNSKMLAIPAIPEAYGKRPREFGILELVGSRKHGFLALVEKQRDVNVYGRRRKDGTYKLKQVNKLGGRIFFWLVPQTTHQADYTVLPADDVMANAVAGDLSKYLQALAIQEASRG
jgi:hypothetical protein